MSVNVDDLIQQAYAAVEKAGIPEPLQAIALKEAIDFLRADQAPVAPNRPNRKQVQRDETKQDETDGVDEDAFFAQLAHESGESEQDLRDILNLTAEGKVQVIPATRLLGSSVSEQAKTVIALVSSARGKGLNERRVIADEVRAELTRKGCYQANNFAASHLGPLKGFNAGSDRSEILLTSKWVDEFSAAVAKANGRSATSGD